MSISHGEDKISMLRRSQLRELELLKELDRICLKHGLTYWIDGGTLLGAIRHGGFIPWDDDIDVCMPRKDFDIFKEIAVAELPDDMEVDDSGPETGSDFNLPCVLRDRLTKIVKSSCPMHMGKGLFIDLLPVDSFHSSGVGKVIDLSAKILNRAVTKIHQDPLSGPGLPRSFMNNALMSARRLVSMLPFITTKVLAKRMQKILRHLFIERGFNRRDSGGLVGYGFDVRWTRLFKREWIFPVARIPFEDILVNAPCNPNQVLQIFYGRDYMIPLPPEQRLAPHFEVVEFIR